MIRKAEPGIEREKKRMTKESSSKAAIYSVVEAGTSQGY
jgi:hypothetical protein